MTITLYIADILVALLCAILLLRAYIQVRRKMLLWSGICFVMLTVNNLLVLADLILFPEIDLYTFRLCAVAIALVLLIYGLIWESQ